jgi:hypothetical protein
VTASESDPPPSGATLRFEDGPTVWVSGERQLRDALEALPAVGDRRFVMLERDPKHYVKAHRRGEFWAVSTRNGGWWTMHSFTADFTADYSDREMRRSWESGTFLGRFIFWGDGTAALSSGQVERIFADWLLGRELAVPFVSA